MGTGPGRRGGGWRAPHGKRVEEGLIPFSCWLESEGRQGQPWAWWPRVAGDPAERVGRKGQGRHEGLAGPLTAAVPSKVPWDDLRYLFGEIMYGGHITDDWDRRLCRTYLAEYIRAEMLEGEILLAPGFQIPPNLDYKVRRAPSRDGVTHETRAPSGRQSNRGVLARGLPGEGLRHGP